jgi:hypothetical protein
MTDMTDEKLVSLTTGVIAAVLLLIIGGGVGAAINSGRTEASCERRLWAQKEAFWQERYDWKRAQKDEQLLDRKPVWEPHP